jgi:hypothetical protein
MTCKICGSECCKPSSRPAEKVYVPHVFDTIGTYLRPMEDCDLCWYHQKKANGHLDRGDEYYRFNRGPHEWTPYKSFYPPGSQYL